MLLVERALSHGLKNARAGLWRAFDVCVGDSGGRGRRRRARGCAGVKERVKWIKRQTFTCKHAHED